MYKIMIERSITLVYNDNGTEDFNADDIAGTLVNNEETVDLIKLMPISRYYINLNGTIMSLNLEQTIFAYNKINEENKKELEKSKRKRRTTN